MKEPDKSVDILGIKPVSDAALVVTKATTVGAGAFLSRICLPAAEEFGLLLQDKVRQWRAEQALSITAKAEERYREMYSDEKRHAHPRIVGAILENGSWEDDDKVQEMWAGLLTSSCTIDGRSQENLIFVNLLASITSNQAKLLAFACANATTRVAGSDLPLADGPTVSREKLFEIFETADIHVLDVALDHLREVGLLSPGTGLNIWSPDANGVEPSALGLHFYARCHGHSGSVLAFYGLTPKADAEASPNA